MNKTMEFELTEQEELGILREWAKKRPLVLKVLLKHPKGHCPFGSSCNRFPCERLYCNADECDNGYAFRRS